MNSTNLKWLSKNLDYLRIPLNATERAERQGEIPYWGANGIVDYVDEALIEDRVVLIGEDGAPFFERDKDVAFVSNGPIWPNNNIHILKPDPRLISDRFLSYFLNQVEYAKYINGSTRDKLTQAQLGSIRIRYPKLESQNRIADFLDRETARIDALIAKKERLVEVQETRLLSLLQKLVLGGAAVRRGLAGDWLHDLPEGWQLIPLKHLVSVAGGATPSKNREDFWDGDIPWVSPRDMKSDLIINTQHRISEGAVESSALRVIPSGAVLIVVRGMILARMIPICQLGMSATINQDMKALLAREKLVRGDYLQRMLQGFKDVLMSFVEEAAHGTKKLRSDALFGLKFPIPPLRDQERLSAEYEKARVWTEKINAATLASIDRLREYRAALITAAVTGQIDVATWGKQGQTDRRLDEIEEAMRA